MLQLSNNLVEMSASSIVNIAITMIHVQNVGLVVSKADQDSVRGSVQLTATKLMVLEMSPVTICSAVSYDIIFLNIIIIRVVP